MKKIFLVLPFVVALVLVVVGCQKKVIPPPPPPPPPPVVEKKAEPAPVDSTEILARIRREKVAQAKQKIASERIYFDFDKSDIKPEFRPVLEGVADLMKEYSELRVRIEGHCDERGTDAYNLGLGERRCNSARQFLMDAGVAGDRMDAKSWGEALSAASGHNEAAWSKNRRDEFIIIE